MTSMNQSFDILPRHRAREGAREHYNHIVRMTDLEKQVCSWYLQLPLGPEHYCSHKVGGVQCFIRSSNDVGSCLIRLDRIPAQGLFTTYVMVEVHVVIIRHRARVRRPHRIELVVCGPYELIYLTSRSMDPPQIGTYEIVSEGVSCTGPIDGSDR